MLASDSSARALTPIKKCWELPGSVNSDAGISADNSQGYVVDSKGRIVAVELGTGAIAWAADFGGMPVSEIALTSSSVVLAARSGGEDPSSRPITVSSFSKATGLPNWRVELAPAVRYFLEVTDLGLVSVSRGGEILLLNETDGKTVWKSTAAAQLVSDPNFANGRLQIASAPKRIQEFSLSNGRLLWDASMQSVPSIVGVPAGGGSIYVDEKGIVYSVNQSGGTRWKFKAGGKIIFAELVGENLLLGSADNFVYYISADGDLIWKRRLSGRVASGGVVGEEKAAFTVVGDRSAFVIDLKDGRVVDKISLDDEDDTFLMTPIRANGLYLLAATTGSLSAYSANCRNEKSGDAKSPLP